MRWSSLVFQKLMVAVILTLPLMAGTAFGAEVRVALNADIRGTMPGTNRDSNTDTIVLHLVEGLVAYREDGTVGPLLSERVDISDDGLTYTFTLREGVKFHNGETLSAKHVIWSWKRYMDSATDWRCQKDFSGGDVKIESITEVDARTVRFVINKPSGLFLVNMARPDCGMAGIIHPSSVAADGSWVGPVGTGPFMVESWKKGESITLAKFKDYVSRLEPRDGFAGGKQVDLDRVKFIVIPDSAAANTALLTGEIQVIPDIPTSAKREMEAKKNITTKTSATLGVSAILFQTRDPLLSKVEMRQAIAAALDMKQIVAAVTEGICQPNNSLVPSASVYYSDVQRKGFSYDPEKAKIFLKQAGYRGEPIILLTNKRYESSYNIAVFAQSMLQSAGINVQIEVLEWGTQLDRYLAGTYQMMAFPYSARLDPALAFDAVMGPKDKQPRKAWDNPEAQALLLEAMKISDRAKRQNLFDQLHGMLIADAPMIVLYNGPEIAVFSKNVHGYIPWALSQPRFWGVTLVK